MNKIINLSDRRPLTLAEKLKARHKYIGKHVERGCAIAISLDGDGLFNMLIMKRKQFPTYKDIVTARYKYLPDDAYMIIIFPPIREFAKNEKNTIMLWEIKNDKK